MCYLKNDMCCSMGFFKYEIQMFTYVSSDIPIQLASRFNSKSTYHRFDHYPIEHCFFLVNVLWVIKESDSF